MTESRLESKALALILAVTSLVLPLRATTLARMSLDQLARAADTVVRAQCVGTSAKRENGAIWTFADFTTLENFKGKPAAHIQVRLPGGSVGNLSTRIEEVPAFQPGDDAVLFLEHGRDGIYGVTAWVEGTFRIQQNAATGDERVTQDSAGTAVFDPATRNFRREGIRNMPWSSFRLTLIDTLMKQTGGSK